MWTDAELDEALASQPAGPEFSPEARARALARLHAEAAAGPAPAPVTLPPAGALSPQLARSPAGALSPRVALSPLEAGPVRVAGPARAAGGARRGRWLAAAAAVVVLAGAGGVTISVLGGGEAAASAAAVAQLDRAAGATSDGPTAPGQYFYTERHDWALAAAQTRTGKNLAQLQETMSQSWVPHERSRDWVRVTAVTGQTKWLIGSDDLVRREGDGGLLSPAGRKREVGPCGDFPGDNGELTKDGYAPRLPCDQRPGDFYEPTPRFLAGLPADPEKMYQRLAAGDPGGPADLLQMAQGVLTADAPAATRATVYRALTLVPGLDVTSDAVNLDGRHGVGLGITEGALRHEIVIDPGTGQFIGDRLVLTRPGTDMWAGLPAGTVAEYSAVTTSVVDVVPR